MAVAADPPAKLDLMARENGIDPSFVFLSDGELVLAQVLKVATSGGHPKAISYPKKAFLQPSVFVFDRTGTERFAWRQKPGLLNLFGAARRMEPPAIEAEVERIALEEAREKA